MEEEEVVPGWIEIVRPRKADRPRGSQRLPSDVAAADASRPSFFAAYRYHLCYSLTYIYPVLGSGLNKSNEALSTTRAPDVYNHHKLSTHGLRLSPSTLEAIGHF